MRTTCSVVVIRIVRAAEIAGRNLNDLTQLYKDGILKRSRFKNTFCPSFHWTGRYHRLWNSGRLSFAAIKRVCCVDQTTLRTNSGGQRAGRKIRTKRDRRKGAAGFY